MSRKLLVNKSNKKTLGLSSRLRGRENFVRFFKNPKKAACQYCIIYQVPNSDNKARLGITLKIRTSSVVRNRIRRVIREAFRTTKNDLGSFDYNVVISQAKSFAHPYSIELKRSLTECFLQFLKAKC